MHVFCGCFNWETKLDTGIFTISVVGILGVLLIQCFHYSFESSMVLTFVLTLFYFPLDSFLVQQCL